MPDHPFVYGSPPPRPVAPGGTRIRVLRRRSQRETTEGEEEHPSHDTPANDAAWGQLLTDAVGELNTSFAQAGTEFTASLEEEPAGFFLVLRRRGDGGTPAEVEEEFLSPGELPQWLTRLRLRLGLLIDETT